jgi:predicted transcriptional regulator
LGIKLLTKLSQHLINKKKSENASGKINNSSSDGKHKKTPKSNNQSRVKGKHPLEIEFWFILPAVRRELALRLFKKKLKQRDIAKIVGMTEAAVSQYIKGNRGRLTIKDNEDEHDIEIPGWLCEEIDESAKIILEDRSESIFIKETNRIMQIIRSKPKEFLCYVHEILGEKVDDCEVCFTGIVIETY